LHRLLALLACVWAFAAAISNASAQALPSQYVSGMTFNHTIRISPTSGPPTETNALNADQGCLDLRTKEIIHQHLPSACGDQPRGVSVRD
jgi:hypothetical protein